MNKFKPKTEDFILSDIELGKKVASGLLEFLQNQIKEIQANKLLESYELDNGCVFESQQA